MNRWFAVVAAAGLVAAVQAEPPTTDPATGVSSPHAASSPADSRSTAPAATLDRLRLDTTTITGNRELPRVMYVVPWKKADPGDLSGRPANSLLDEVLAPVDRDVFRRQLRYYSQIDRHVAAPSSDAAKSANAVGAH